MFYKPEFKDSPEHFAAKAAAKDDREATTTARAEPATENPPFFTDDDEPLLSLSSTGGDGGNEKQQVDFDSMLDDLFSPTSSQKAPLGGHANATDVNRLTPALVFDRRLSNDFRLFQGALPRNGRTHSATERPPSRTKK